MKRLLLIICLLPVLAFGQFSGAKKLLLQQGEYCEYGNLANYTTELLMVVHYQSTACGIPFTEVTSLATAKQVLDYLRSCTLTEAYGSVRGFCITASVGNTVLNYQTIESQNTAICELFPISDFWGFANITNFPLNSVPIYHIENGVITYIEYY